MWYNKKNERGEYMSTEEQKERWSKNTEFIQRVAFNHDENAFDDYLNYISELVKNNKIPTVDDVVILRILAKDNIAKRLFNDEPTL